MKNLLFALLLAVAGIAQAASVPPVGLPGPFLTERGGMLRSGGIFIGISPGAVAQTEVIACTAGNAITVTWPVALSSVTMVAGSTSSPYLVTPTATLGDPTFFGIALNTAATGEVVYVAVRGIALGNVTPAVTKGDKLITGGAAGTFARVTAVSEALFTGLSNTAIVGRVMKSAGAGSKVPIFLGK